MTSVELNANRMEFKNGTAIEFYQKIDEIVRLDSEIPNELMDNIIATLRERSKEGGHEKWFPYVIHKLLGRTKSMALYKVAEELGYLNIGRFECPSCADGKVELFVKQKFYHPELEALAIDELHRWLKCFDQAIRKHYRGILEQFEPESERACIRWLKEHPVQGLVPSICAPIMLILHALNESCSSNGRDSLLALEYLFRPKLNDYLVINQKWLQDCDERAMKQHEEIDDNDPLRGRKVFARAFAPPSVYDLESILDYIADIARTESPCGVTDKVTTSESTI